MIKVTLEAKHGFHKEVLTRDSMDSDVVTSDFYVKDNEHRWVLTSTETMTGREGTQEIIDLKKDGYIFTSETI